MTSGLLRLFLCLLFWLPVASAATAQDEEVPAGRIATQTDVATDAAIATRIRNILAELGGYDDVTVDVGAGIVRIAGTTATAGEAAALDDLVSRVDGVVAVRNTVAETTDISRRLNPALARFQARLAQIVTVLPLLLIAVVVFGIVASLGRFVVTRKRPWDRISPNAFIADLYRQIVMILFVVVGLVVALDILDASALLSTILGAAGIVGLAFGFAVRDTVENYIASIMLSLRQPFRPNDTIEINGDEGKVIRLTSRATILMSFDGNQIRIPNATVFKSRIVNYSTNAERRFKFTVTIDAGADIAAIRVLTVDTVQSLPFTLATPEALTWITDFNDAGVELCVTGWIDQNDTSLVLARGEALRQVKAVIEAAGVTIPDKGYRLTVAGPGRFDLTETDLADDAAGTPTPPATRPPPPLPGTTEDVADRSDTALNDIIETERAQPGNDDLLRPDAQTE